MISSSKAFISNRSLVDRSDGYNKSKDSKSHSPS